jgi:hypothetical protein
MVSMAMLCQPLRKFPIGIPIGNVIPIGFENSYRINLKISIGIRIRFENYEKNSCRK